MNEHPDPPVSAESHPSSAPLDDAPLNLNGYALVNLRFALADIRREADGRTYHALVRFRAVTEPQ